MAHFRRTSIGYICNVLLLSPPTFTLLISSYTRLRIEHGNYWTVGGSPFTVRGDTATIVCEEKARMWKLETSWAWHYVLDDG